MSATSSSIKPTENRHHNPGDHNIDKKMNLSYQECEEYILNIPQFYPASGAGGKHTLAELYGFLARLGGPGMKRKVIHVAGTNGKGSVCAYLQSIMDAAGIKAGMFISPHLVTVRERISVAGQMISEAEFIAAFIAVQARITELWHPNFYEFLFLMAMTVFEQHDCEYLILETGLGGRLDATNVVAAPQVCVITKIGFDHMEYLGTTIDAIAGEKAGIMKAGVPTVSWSRTGAAADKLAKEAARAGSPLYPVGPEQIKIDKKIKAIGNKSIDFSFHSRYDRYVRLKLDTCALYQTENAALAVQAAELLRECRQEERITADVIRRGLLRAVWPGRMEELWPGVIADGAHNEDGIAAFIESVRADQCGGKRYLLYGGVRDKRYRQHIAMLKSANLFAAAAAAPLDNNRSLSYEELADVFLSKEDETVWSGRVFADLSAGLKFLADKKKAADLIYITGSLYLIGQVKRGKLAGR